MSEQVPLDTLPLFAPERAPAPVIAVHSAAEIEHLAFFGRLRRLLGNMYGGGKECTADDARRVMEQYRIALPPGASPNVLGSLFSQWNRAHSTGRMVRSKRDGANGNPLVVWRID